MKKSTRGHTSGLKQILQRSWTIILLLLVSLFTFAQPNTWVRTPKSGADLLAGRFAAVSFSIGDKAYMGTGRDDRRPITYPLQPSVENYDDFWEYNQTTHAWRQMARFMGAARSEATGFSIGDTGYVGFGRSGQFPFVYDDFYQFDPVANAWTRKRSLGDALGLPRARAVGFSINGKGYIGTGGISVPIQAAAALVINYYLSFLPLLPSPAQEAYALELAAKVGTSMVTLSDFWEFDPKDGPNGKWSQVRDFSGGKRNAAVGLTIGGKGYVVAGSDEFGAKNDAWEYNPNIGQDPNNGRKGTWTQKNTYPGGATTIATGFSIGNLGYIQSGADFWEFNPANISGQWVRRASFPGAGNSVSTGFSIGSIGYVGFGNTAQDYKTCVLENPLNHTCLIEINHNVKVPSNEVFEYHPYPYLNTIVDFSSIKAGSPFAVRFISINDLNNGNSFIAQLSDAAGNFTSPVTIGTGVLSPGSVNGSINAIIPANFPAGKGYHIRVIAVNPAIYGGNAPAIEIIAIPPSITTNVTVTSFCAPSSVKVSFTASGAFTTGNTFTAQLSDANGSFANAVNIGTVTSLQSGTINATIPSNIMAGIAYRIRVVSSKPVVNGSNNSTNLTINSTPILTSTLSPAAICNNSNFTYIPTGSPSGTTFGWSRAAVPGISNPATSSAPSNTSGAIREKLTNSTGSPVNVGYLYSLNNHGCTNTTAFKVMVTVKPSPLVKTKNITVYLDANGKSTVIPGQINNGSVSYCGALSLALSKTSFNCDNIGANTVTLTVTDGSGNSTSGTATVMVIDKLAPSITDVSAIPNVLWPPDHQMNDVTINYTASDNCGTVSSSLSVTSNEPVNGKGDGDTSPDWIILNDHHVQLRAERSGKGNGRVYTITITSTDASGNTSTQTNLVNVPHNGNPKMDYVDQLFDCRVIPNPSSHYFELQVNSGSNEKIEVNLYDIRGRFLSRMNAVKNQVLRFGSNLRPGTYMVEVIQGQHQQRIFVIKE